MCTWNFKKFYGAFWSIWCEDGIRKNFKVNNEHPCSIQHEPKIGMSILQELYTELFPTFHICVPNRIIYVLHTTHYHKWRFFMWACQKFGLHFSKFAHQISEFSCQHIFKDSFWQFGQTVVKFKWVWIQSDPYLDDVLRRIDWTPSSHQRVPLLLLLGCKHIQSTSFGTAPASVHTIFTLKINGTWMLVNCVCEVGIYCVIYYLRGPRGLNLMDHGNWFCGVFWQRTMRSISCFLPHQKILILTKVIARRRLALKCDSITCANFNSISWKWPLPSHIEPTIFMGSSWNLAGTN